MAEIPGGWTAWIDAVRRNHGTEHATVAVLFARTKPRRIAGRASRDGFFIIGGVEEGLLLSCAREALQRMQHGEPDLAVSPHCGTNLAVAAALATFTSMRALAKHPERPWYERFGDGFTAAVFALIAAQPLGRLLQQHLTTRADVHGMEIVEVRTYLPWVQKVVTRGA